MTGPVCARVCVCVHVRLPHVIFQHGKEESQHHIYTGVHILLMPCVTRQLYKGLLCVYLQNNEWVTVNEDFCHG